MKAFFTNGLFFEKNSLNFARSSFAIHVLILSILKHGRFFMAYYKVTGVYLPKKKIVFNFPSSWKLLFQP